jgi:6-pyruvoyltetrahydropterin/6-carboxytetrahydropterin synthase
LARQTLKVRHNIEVAHRLSLLPGKCEQIHGHSMWVVMELFGDVDEAGILLGLDFASVKREFRGHLDASYDHHLLLNKADTICQISPVSDYLTGLVEVPGDPTTENIARWIGEWASEQFGVPGLYRIRVEVWETMTNSATWEALLEPDLR